MQVDCGRCHAHFEVESMQDARCPQCGASAGLEPRHAAQLPIQAFGLLLVVCVGLALTSLGLAFAA